MECAVVRAVRCDVRRVWPGAGEPVPEQAAAAVRRHHPRAAAVTEPADPAHGRLDPGGHGVGRQLPDRRRRADDTDGARLGRGAPPGTAALTQGDQGKRSETECKNTAPLQLVKIGPIMQIMLRNVVLYCIAGPYLHIRAN